MPPGAFVVNRVHQAGGPPPGQEQVASRLAAEPALQGISHEELGRAARALRESYLELETLALVDAKEIERLRARCGEGQPYLLVPFLDGDVYDAEALAKIERRLFTEPAPSRPSNS
jgi:hypothetical protein